MIRYLLGLLPEIERGQFEERSLADGCLLEEMRVIEDELIDDYVSEHLSESYRERFEQHYLRLEEHRQRVSFALALKLYSEKSTAENNIPKQNWWRRLLWCIGIKVLML